SQPPMTAPTTPSTMSSMNPSPDLLTSLLPMKPAIKPRTIQAKNDMIFLLILLSAQSGLTLLTRRFIAVAMPYRPVSLCTEDLERSSDGPDRSDSASGG